MEEQQQNQQLLPERNGNRAELSLLNNAVTFQENKTDEGDLQQLLVVARRRAFLIGSIASIVFVTVWFWTLSRQPRYEGDFQLLVESVTDENKLAGLTQNQETNTNQQQEGLDYESQIKVMQSPKVMAPIIKQISTRYPDISYESLMANMSLNRLQKTKILEIRYQDSSPQKIQFVLQELATGYLKYRLQERQTNLGQGNQFVDSQLPLLQARVNSRQKELQQFRQRYSFIDPEVKAEQLSQQVISLEQQRLDTQKELAETRAKYAALQSHSTLEVLKEAPVYQKLVDQLSDVESQIAVELVRFRPDSPTVQLLRQKRENLLPVLRQEEQRALGNTREEVANQIALLDVRAEKIAQAENSLKQQIKQAPTLTRQYTDLERELKVDTESLNRFLEKRESLQIETAQKEIPWQLIKSPKVPRSPVYPNVPQNLLLGAITGLLAGMGAALLVERTNNVLHSSDELKEVTKLPILGIIPFQKQLKQLSNVAEATAEVTVVKKPNGYQFVSRNISKAQDYVIGAMQAGGYAMGAMAAGYSNFPFLEAFRSLHSNIIFLGSSDKPIHSLAVSSTVKGEGKSTVALNLAQAAAAMGRRVLLVDADLRLPQIHNLLSLPNKQGLSNVISTNLPLSKVIQQSPVENNLFVLTSGQIPPDPTKLLSSIALHNIMEELRQQFDLVIYDTPPLLGLADGRLIATYTDGIVLVVRASSTERSLLKQALDGLKIARITILGTVLNGVEINDNATYGYYQRPSLSKSSN